MVNPFPCCVIIMWMCVPLLAGPLAASGGAYSQQWRPFIEYLLWASLMLYMHLLQSSRYLVEFASYSTKTKTQRLGRTGYLQGGDLGLEIVKFDISASALFPDCFMPWILTRESTWGGLSRSPLQVPNTHKNSPTNGKTIKENFMFKISWREVCIVFSLFSFCYLCMVTSSCFSCFHIKFEL